MQMTIATGIGPGQARKGQGGQNIPHSSPVTLIAADGWRATYPDPPVFDPENAPQTLSVTRQGFDENATPIPVVEALTMMARVRAPYPAQETLTQDQVALSDFVYAGEAIVGVNNTSARAYPKPIAAWLNHDRERATGSNHTLRLAVAHAYARKGRPVAAVKFTLTDGTTTVEQTVSTMTSTSYDASGLSVPHFAADMDLSTLMQGALLVVDAVIYPWVGEAFTISMDADSYPSPNLTTWRLLNDRTGAYGTAYAYVNAQTGDNTTAVVSETPTSAQGTPFATIKAAAAAIKTFNAVTFGRTNDAGGGIIRLEPGTHAHANFRADGVSTDIPLVIEGADPTARATTIFTDHGASTAGGTPYALKLQNITIQKTGGSVILFDSGVGDMSGLLVTQDCVWDSNATSYYAAWIYRVGRFQQINCSIGAGGDPRQGNQFSTEAKAVMALGCESCAGSITYIALGCSGVETFVWRAAFGAKPAMAGVFLGWNIFSNGTSTNSIVNVAQPIDARGFAFVGNIIESWGSTTNAALRINADSDASPTQNVVVHHNTIVGERANLLYLDSTTNVEKSGYVRANVFQRSNIKSDVFASNGGNTGNWSARYKVGWSHNVALEGANNASTYDPVSWLGEIPSSGEVHSITPLWQDDRSNSGTDTGDGDYRPLANSPLPVIPAGLTGYPTDLLGAPALEGVSRVGASMSSA